MMESDSKTVLIDICPIDSAAGALVYEETWWHVLEVRVREGCSPQHCLLNSARALVVVRRNSVSIILFWMPATPYEGNGPTPFILAFITFFNIRSFSILSTCPSHLKTFISILVANQLPHLFFVSQPHS